MNDNDKSNAMCSAKDYLAKLLYGVTLVIYMYVICLLIAGTVNSACDVSGHRHILHRSYNIGDTHSNDCSGLLNTSVLMIITFLYSKHQNVLFIWVKDRGCLNFWKNTNKNICSRFQLICDLLSVWTTLINLILIVLCNPSILNPGPAQNITVMYQNVRGFAPLCL